MKNGSILGGIVGALVGLVVAIRLDVWLGACLFGLIPDGEWAGLVKVGIVFGLVWLTAGLCVLVALGTGILSATLTEWLGTRNDR